MTNQNTILHIYHWDFYILTRGALNTVPAHIHNASQIFVNTIGAQKIKIGNTVLCNPIIYVDQNIEHEVIHADENQLSILIDGDSRLSKHLAHRFLKGQAYSTDLHLLDYFNVHNPTDVKHQLYKLTEKKGCTICAPADIRIKKVKEIIDRDEEKKLPLSKLAEQVNLSESRLAHLFKDEVGIPLRKYLLWKRLISALKIILEGHNLTYAAHSAGFSDSAHLSRTFKSNFGINLSKIFKNSKFIQFHSL